MMSSQNEDIVKTSSIRLGQPIRLLTFVSAVLVGIIVLGGLPLSHAFADSATPTQPTNLKATPCDQGVSLTWNASSNVTAYQIQVTDLVTQTVEDLDGHGTQTHFTVRALQTGRWYRFQIIPLNGSVTGPASLLLDARTTGYSGSYSSYFAMGDSYSSGEGAPPYTDTFCAQSNSSFAYQLGNGVPTPLMLACAGATTDNIDKTAQVPGGTQAWEQAVGQLGKPGDSIITVSIGGNDIGFAPELQKCILGDCTPDQATISQKISDLQSRLAQVYNEIRKVSPGADIFIVEYPLLVASPDQAVCHDSITQNLSAGEMTMMRTLATQLHNEMQTIATQDGYTLVQAASAFAGHEACTSDQSQEWINEVTTSDLSGSFHPNAAGYVAYANAINAARNNLYTSGQVRPDPSKYPSNF